MQNRCSFKSKTKTPLNTKQIDLNLQGGNFSTQC